MVVLKPLDWKALLIKLDSILLAGLLHSHVPDSVLEVRTNYMRNFLALNARNLESTKVITPSGETVRLASFMASLMIYRILT